jgi:hypothetical protein
MLAAWASATASSTVRAVSGWEMMSSTHCAKEKVVGEVAAGRAATEAAIAKAAAAARGIAVLTISTRLMASNLT